MNSRKLRFAAITIFAIAAVLSIAQGQVVLAQEEPLCTATSIGGCKYNGCETTQGICYKIYPSSPCVCGYIPN